MVHEKLNTLTTIEAAAVLGVTDARVRQLLLEGRLPGIKHGRDWQLTWEAVESYKAKGEEGDETSRTAIDS